MQDLAREVRPISRNLADAILCEAKFRTSHWYNWNLSPHEKRLDRNLKNQYDREERRRAYVLDLITTGGEHGG
jgi:hypothetical protein